jgi:hypothetical protein
VVRAGLAGRVLPAAGKTPAEGANPAVAVEVVCPGVATASVDVLGHTERPLVPAIVPAPGMLTDCIAGFAKRLVK